jgi:hypothetical protein
VNALVGLLAIASSATSAAPFERPWLFEYSIVSAGVLGLFAIGLIPVRSWQEIRGARGYLRVGYGGVAFFAALVLISAAAIVAEINLLAHLCKCLLGLHCGPLRASGIVVAAGIGFWYLCFEFLILLIRFAAKRTLGSGAGV